MKTTLLITVIMLLAGVHQSHSQNPVPNKGFENWTMGEPNAWTTNNAPGFYVPITQEMPGAMGNSAAKGEIVSQPIGAILPLLTSVNSMGDGFAVSQKYNTLSFYYKFNPTGTSVFNASVAMFNNSTLTESGSANYTAATPTWTHTSVPLSQVNAMIPNECIINFLLTDTAQSPVAGDHFVVDEVELSGASSVQEIAASKLEKLYPNPADDFVSVYYAMAESGSLRISISDMLGRVVHEQFIEREIAGRHKIILRTGELLLGQYVVHLESSSGSGSLMLFVER